MVGWVGYFEFLLAEKLKAKNNSMGDEILFMIYFVCWLHLTPDKQIRPFLKIVINMSVTYNLIILTVQ